jgi:hypothetical protein
VAWRLDHFLKWTAAELATVLLPALVNISIHFHSLLT